MMGVIMFFIVFGVNLSIQPPQMRKQTVKLWSLLKISLEQLTKLASIGMPLIFQI